MNSDQYEPVIGLEIHVELKTGSKMFCGCAADWFGKKPNTLTCPVCLGLPGALPVPNEKAVEWCVMLGLALGCEIPLFSKFDRKNYFYPDLPKGYQISQYDKPFAANGRLNIKISGRDKIIGIRRVHMEEDTGKLLHAKVSGENYTLIDFNRSGVPLVEIVTEPDIRGSEEASIFLKKLHQIIRYLEISDADMEKGSMRLEPNISLRPAGSKDLPVYKVEVKNINSFNFVKKSIDFEVERQADILAGGNVPAQETRGWDEKKGITYTQRSKEEAHDYRYFPEPDIPPIRWRKEYIDTLRSRLPELPDEKDRKFLVEYKLPQAYASLASANPTIASYLEESVNVAKKTVPNLTPKTLADWILNKKIDITETSPEELVKLIQARTQTAKMDEKELENIVKKILSDNPKAVADYKAGKQASIMFLVGQVMRETRGKANAEKVKQKLIELLV